MVTEDPPRPLTTLGGIGRNEEKSLLHGEMCTVAPEPTKKGVLLMDAAGQRLSCDVGAISAARILSSISVMRSFQSMLVLMSLIAMNPVCSQVSVLCVGITTFASAAVSEGFGSWSSCVWSTYHSLPSNPVMATCDRLCLYFVLGCSLHGLSVGNRLFSHTSSLLYAE